MSTMDAFGKIIAPGALRFERTLPGPIDRVWAYLTESEKRGRWLARGDMELFEGGKVELHFLHTDLSPLPAPVPEKFGHMASGHNFSGKVLRVQPPHLLSFTWEGQSEVTFELSQKDDRVHLVLTHRKLGGDSMTNTLPGWHTHLDILGDVLDGTAPASFWEQYDRLEKEYHK